MLSESELHVWHAALVPGDHPALAGEDWLSPDEHRREQRFLHPADRIRFRLARSLLRLILGRYLGVAPAAVCFDYGHVGKPSLGGQFRDSQIEFNLSHSADVMLLGVTRGQPLGVDVERLRTEIAIENMAERFFAPGEVQHLLSLEVERRREAFFTIWSRKEAYIKARGLGLSASLDGFHVSTHPENPPPVQFIAVQPDDPIWHLYPLNAPTGYFAAACTTRSQLTVRYMNAPATTGRSGLLISTET